MARSNKPVAKRKFDVDPVYGNRMLVRLINGVMRSGKKSIAQKQIYQAMELLKAKGNDPIKTMEQAINAVGPRLEVRPRRVGGASYQVPMEVKGDRRLALAIRWIIQAANKRGNKEYHTFKEKLAAEILDILQNQGDSIRKRDTVHRMAEANRAFAHFRW